MRLGRKRRQEQRASEALSEIRRDLRALDVQMRKTLTDVTSHVESRLTDATTRDDALLQVLQTLGERMEADRLERRALIDALAAFARASQAQRVVGGSFFAPTADLDAIEAFDLARAEHANGDDVAVEVRCRFGDRWVDGFEVADVVDDGSSFRYRLRRRSDGAVLPTLFEARNVRRADELPLAERPTRRWSS